MRHQKNCIYEMQTIKNREYNLIFTEYRIKLIVYQIHETKYLSLFKNI